MKPLQHFASAFLATATFVLFASAAPARDVDAPARMGQMPPGERIVQALNLDGARAEQVRSIMRRSFEERRAVWADLKDHHDPAAREAARAQLQSIRERTRAQLAQVLTADEMQKLRSMRRHPDAKRPKQD
ncbi:MAG: hypothetical protein NZ533_08910 [Casimicrobiaceae bacterium]|nr:hypothetical protein [Casimicrobiaceae bacterium]MCX8098652.1 hypothetical protein [Casimicrobiaceae bacterium]MDW8311911.1 hypothetical protein [Burkholderiales bacterium]